MIRGEYKAGEFVKSITGRPVCCDESALMGEINRHFRRLIVSECDTEEFHRSLSVALYQASAMFCAKGGSETRHLEALFSIMRMLGLRRVYT